MSKDRSFTALFGKEISEDGPGVTFSKLEVVDLGLVGYPKALEFQKRLLSHRKSSCGPDYLILLEHLPVITIGRSGSWSNILSDLDILKKKRISIHMADRGGDVTYHGPGQLVAYPVIDLNNFKKSIRRFLRNLEQVVIEFLKSYLVAGKRIEGLTGVWVDRKKIASIGVGISRWVTYHGLAININPDMSNFSMIRPCGMEPRKMASLAQILGKDLNIIEAKRILIRAFETVFGVTTDQTSQNELHPFGHRYPFGHRCSKCESCA